MPPIKSSKISNDANDTIINERRSVMRPLKGRLPSNNVSVNNDPILQEQPKRRIEITEALEKLLDLKIKKAIEEARLYSESIKKTPVVENNIILPTPTPTIGLGQEIRKKTESNESKEVSAVVNTTTTNNIASLDALKENPTTIAVDHNKIEAKETILPTKTEVQVNVEKPPSTEENPEENITQQNTTNVTSTTTSSNLQPSNTNQSPTNVVTKVSWFDKLFGNV